MRNDSECPRLLDYLPAIYHRSPQVGTFLAPFEATLFGSNTPEILDTNQPTPQKSVDELIGGIPELFDPEEVLPEFLPWLAQWVALTAHEGIPESRRRQLIYKIIPLYAIRGTKVYVEQTIGLYMGVKADIEEEDLPGMQIGTRSMVGHDTRLGEDPFQFVVELDFSSVPDVTERLPELLEFANVVVNLAKPAHTHFRLTHNVTGEEKGLVISVRSTVGTNTLLWK